MSQTLFEKYFDMILNDILTFEEHFTVVLSQKKNQSKNKNAS